MSLGRDKHEVRSGKHSEMRAILERIVPANNAEKIRKPLFVIQGANDPRVPRSESEQINLVAGAGQRLRGRPEACS